MSTSTQVRVPSFATQLSSMINFVRFCQQEQVPTSDALRQSWTNIEKTVIIPNGPTIDSLLIPDIPGNTHAIDLYVSEVCTLARGIFDPRVEQFNLTALTPTIALSQGLHRKKLFEQAVNMELLTAEPVDAMVASALKVKPLITDTDAWITLGSFSGAVGGGALAGLLLLLSEGKVDRALVWGAAAVVGLTGSWLLFKKFSNLHRMYFPPQQ